MHLVPDMVELVVGMTGKLGTQDIIATDIAIRVCFAISSQVYSAGILVHFATDIRMDFANGTPAEMKIEVVVEAAA